MRGSAEIVGGGIGGLFTGYMLAKQGWRVRINERHSQIREIGAGLYMKNNAVTLLEHVGIADIVLGLAEAARSAGASVVTDAAVARVDPEGLVVLATGEARAADLIVVASGF